jgi:hypothetical protein
MRDLRIVQARSKSGLSPIFDGIKLAYTFTVTEYSYTVTVTVNAK